MGFVVTVPEAGASTQRETDRSASPSAMPGGKKRKRTRRTRSGVSRNRKRRGRGSSATPKAAVVPPALVVPPAPDPVPGAAAAPAPGRFHTAGILQYSEEARRSAYILVMDKLFGMGNADDNSKLARVGELFAAFAKHDRGDDQTTNNSLESFHNWLKNIFFM
jgi:hypothetical protein